jgi:predicted amino acid-binding ACT domain protein
LTKAARAAGLSLSGKKRAFFVQGTDRPGVVTEIHRKLADAGINVTAANGCVAPNGAFGMILWVKPDKFDAAAKTLGVRV